MSKIWDLNDRNFLWTIPLRFCFLSFQYYPGCSLPAFHHHFSFLPWGKESIINNLLLLIHLSGNSLQLDGWVVIFRDQHSHQSPPYLPGFVPNSPVSPYICHIKLANTQKHKRRTASIQSEYVLFLLSSVQPFFIPIAPSIGAPLMSIQTKRPKLTIYFVLRLPLTALGEFLPISKNSRSWSRRILDSKLAAIALSPLDMYWTLDIGPFFPSLWKPRGK